MNRSIAGAIGVTALLLFIAGCATFRSDTEGIFTGQSSKNFGAKKIDVLFIFSHYEQSIGYDAIPKINNKHKIINGFDDLFIDAFNEFSNIDHYSTFTEFASDISDPERMKEEDQLIESHDYVVRIKFMKTNSFAKHFLGGFISTVSATVLPIAYKYDYSIEVDLFNHDNILLKSYNRKASLNKWVQTLLIFIYPFHTEKRKEEEIYLNMMHDVFKQIETEKVLN